MFYVCHSERSEEPRSWDLIETLRSTQGDTRQVLLELLSGIIEIECIAHLFLQFFQASL